VWSPLTQGRDPTASGREALTALAATGCEDGAAGTGAHPKAEAVLLVPATVVRLERPLAHWNDSGTCLEITKCPADPGSDLPLSQGSASSSLRHRGNGGPSPSAAQNGRLNTDRSTVRARPRPGQTGSGATGRTGGVLCVIHEVMHSLGTMTRTAAAPVLHTPADQQRRLRGDTDQTLAVSSTRHAASCPQICPQACG